MQDFGKLYELQLKNQQHFMEAGTYDGIKLESTGEIPVDDIKLFSYHIQQLVSEIGEVLAADKRWKNFRNDVYEKDEKLEEIADCFIVLMNVSMFSGYAAQDIYDAVEHKLNVVHDRIISRENK